MQQLMGTNSTWNWSVVSFLLEALILTYNILVFRLQAASRWSFLFFPLSLFQLLEISFNCLEEVESNIPVSPLHLAVSSKWIQYVNILKQIWLKCRPHVYMPFDSTVIMRSDTTGVLWSLWGAASAVWDISESGCARHWWQNCPLPGCSERFCLMCGSAAETWSLLHTEGAQAQVDGSPCCRCVCVSVCVCVCVGCSRIGYNHTVYIQF